MLSRIRVPRLKKKRVIQRRGEQTAPGAHFRTRRVVPLTAARAAKRAVYNEGGVKKFGAERPSRELGSRVFRWVYRSVSVEVGMRF